MKPGDALGRYRLVRPLARGGMGQVWEAHRASEPEVPLALKLLSAAAVEQDPSAGRRFRAEAEVSLLLKHPNVVNTLDSGEADGRCFLVMELLEGATLAEVTRARPPIELVVSMGLQLLSALDYVHGTAALVHRDIKPSNIFLSVSGQAKVLDFGIARGDRMGLTTTRTGVFRGSLAYCSPEQVKGEALTARSDLFSLGLVLHELLTGERCFPQKNEAALVSAVLFNPIPPPSLQCEAVPPGLETVVMRLLEKDPELRYPSAREASVALTAAVPAQSIASTEAMAEWVRRLEIKRQLERPTADNEVARAAPKPNEETVALRPSASASREVPRRRMRLASVAGAVLATGLGAAAWEHHRSLPAPAQVAPVVIDHAEPAPAAVSAPLKPIAQVEPPAREPPLPISHPSTRHRALKRAATVAAPKTSTEPGWLTLVIKKGWADIVIDGRDVGPSPLFRLSLAPGPHVLEARREGQPTVRRSVLIHPAQETRLGLEGEE